MKTECQCQHHQILREAKAARIARDLIRYPADPEGYQERVRELEAEGLCTSDAQGVAAAMMFSTIAPSS